MDALTLDDVAAALQQMRAEANGISYADIALKITRNRIASGLTPGAATISRHSVYNYFQPGRTRMNAKLVYEIVLVLTGDKAAAQQWRANCIAAQAPKPTADAKSVITPSPGPSSNPAKPRTTSSITEPNTAELSAPKLSVAVPNPALRSPNFIALMLVVGLVANLLPYRAGIEVFGETFPLFLDTIGTAIVAIVLGPRWALAVASLTIFGSAILVNPSEMWVVVVALAPVSMIAALIWGYGVRRLDFTKTLPRFLTLNLIVGIACSLMAFTIIVSAFNGQTMHGAIQLKTEAAITFGLPAWAAALASNLLTSLVDKSIAGVIGLLVAGTALRQYAPPRLVALLAPPQLNFARFAKVAPTRVFLPRRTMA